LIAFLVMHFPPNRFCSRINYLCLTPFLSLDPPLSGWERKSRAALGNSNGVTGGPSALGFQRDHGAKEEKIFCRGSGGYDWKLWDDGGDI